MKVPFTLSGDDGEKTVYLEVADGDGLSIQRNLNIILDTKFQSYNSRSGLKMLAKFYKFSQSPRMSKLQ